MESRGIFFLVVNELANDLGDRDMAVDLVDAVNGSPPLVAFRHESFHTAPNMLAAAEHVSYSSTFPRSEFTRWLVSVEPLDVLLPQLE